jgi:RimJ/RimL family protein N-acetyltransferase
MFALSAAEVSSPLIVGSILIGADEMVAAMVAARIPHVSFDRYTALGVVRRGRLIGGVVYHDYVGHDVQASYAFDSPGWALPGTLRALFDYPFNQLGCRRMTAIMGRKNKKARRMAEGLGFKLEGVHPKGMDGQQDVMSYGMLKEHCRWIKERENGKIERARTAAAA